MSATITSPDVLTPQDTGVPEGWACVTLADVCDINPPKPPKDFLPADAPVTFLPMPAVSEAGGITSPQQMPFAKVRNGHPAFQENDVIMAKITPCMENGKAAITRGLINGVGFGSTEFHVLRSSGAVLPEFVYHFIRQESYRSAAEAEMTGSVGQKRVPPWFLEHTEIPLPPLAEQKRIVEKVEQLLARVNAARERLARVPAILKRFRQAVLAAACSGRLTATWREANPDIEEAANAIERAVQQREAIARKRKSRSLSKLKIAVQDSELPDLESPWCWASLDQIAAIEENAITDGPFGSNLKTDHYREAGPRVIRLQNIGEGKFLDAKAHIAQQHFAQLARHRIWAGDLAIACLGDPVPRACIIPTDVGPAIVKADCIRFRPNSDLAVPEYACYVLNDEATQRRMAEDVHGVGRARLNLQQVKSIPIPLPPLREQQEIARRVEELFKLADAIEKRVAAATARAEKLTQAILAKAFRGQLVPTEAELARRENRTYEPASALLSRLRAERDSHSSSSANGSKKQSVRGRKR